MLQRLIKSVGAQRLGGYLALLCLSLVSVDAKALSCPDNREASGGLCYLKPKDGYSCQATLCVETCRSGYASSGIGTCHYQGTLTYTQRPYLTRSHSGMQRCLALFYNNCRDGYRMNACGICSYQGAWDITRGSYDRGAGINPDVSSAFNRLSDTTRATWGRLLAGMRSGVAQMLAAVNGLLQDQFYKAAVAVASSGRDKLSDCLRKDMAGRLSALQQDANGLNVLKRLIVAGASGKADPQVALDMSFVANHLQLTSQICGASTVKSFGVYSQVEAVAGAGVSAAVGIAMNLPGNGGSTDGLDPRAFIVEGAMFGPAVGATAGIGIFIAMSEVREMNGPGISVGLDAAAVAGGNMGVGFDLPTRLPDFDLTDPLGSYTKWLQGLSPSYSVGLSVGAGGGGAVTFGTVTTARLK